MIEEEQRILNENLEKKKKKKKKGKKFCVILIQDMHIFKYLSSSEYQTWQTSIVSFANFMT